MANGLKRTKSITRIEKVCASLLYVVYGLASYGSAAPAYTPPFENEVFQEFLLGSRLQCPTSSPAATSRRGFETYASENFYLQPDTDRMVVDFVGRHGRCELRHNNYFGVEPTVLKARLKVIPPSSSSEVEELNTIFQIHAKAMRPEFSQGPFCRVVWSRQRNEIHAVVRQNLLPPGEPRHNERFTIQSPLPTDFFDLEIGFFDINGNMEFRIYYNGELRHQMEDMSFYAPFQGNYFKAGVYPHVGGATMEFEKLEAYFDGDAYFEDALLPEQRTPWPTESPTSTHDPTDLPSLVPEPEPKPVPLPIPPSTPPPTLSSSPGDQQSEGISNDWILLWEEDFEETDASTKKYRFHPATPNAAISDAYSSAGGAYSLELSHSKGIAATTGLETLWENLNATVSIAANIQLRLFFDYLPLNGIEEGDGFVLQRWNGTAWHDIQQYTRGATWTLNGHWHSRLSDPTIWSPVQSEEYTQRLRFVSEMRAADNVLYIDNIRLEIFNSKSVAADQPTLDADEDGISSAVEEALSNDSFSWNAVAQDDFEIGSVSSTFQPTTSNATLVTGKYHVSGDSSFELRGRDGVGATGDLPFWEDELQWKLSMSYFPVENENGGGFRLERFDGQDWISLKHFFKGSWDSEKSSWDQSGVWYRYTLSWNLPTQRLRFVSDFRDFDERVYLDDIVLHQKKSPANVTTAPALDSDTNQTESASAITADSSPQTAKIRPTAPPSVFFSVDGDGDEEVIWNQVLEEDFEEAPYSLFFTTSNAAVSDRQPRSGAYSLELRGRDSMISTALLPMITSRTTQQWKLSFDYLALDGVQEGEGFVLEGRDGNRWGLINTFRFGKDAWTRIGQWYSASFTWPASIGTRQLRIVSEMKGDSDTYRVYLDNILLELSDDHVADSAEPSVSPVLTEGSGVIFDETFENPSSSILSPSPTNAQISNEVAMGGK